MSKLFVLFVAVLLPFYVYGQIEIKNLSLKEAVETGIINNPEIKSAKENISASKGRFWNGISLPQPEVGISYEYIPSGKSINNYNEKTFSISQSFEFPSSYFLKGSKFSREEEIAACKMEITTLSVINKIKTSYYKVLAKQHQVKFAEENYSISKDFFKKAEIRQNVGEGTHLEKVSAKVQYAEAGNNLEVLKNELTTAYAELSYSLGYGNTGYNTEFLLTDSLIFSNLVLDKETFQRVTEETNPQVKIARINNEITALDKGIAWTSLLPNFNVSYFKQARDGETGFYGASFGMSVPLWFMFDQRGKIQEANANKSISESDLLLIKNEIALKLKSAFSDYENYLEQVKLYKNEILPQSEEIFKMAVKSYDAGELTYLEYLQARQTLINSRNNYINALFSYFKSLFQIEEITGQGITDK